MSSSGGPDDARYHKSDSCVASFVILLIGLFCSAGGIAIAVAGIRDPGESPWVDAAVGAVLLLPGLLMLVGGGLAAWDAWELRRMGGSSAARRVTPIALGAVSLVMPLSTGLSSLAMFSGSMIAIHVLAFGPIFFASALPEWTLYPVALLVASWFFGVVAMGVEAWKRRASDLLLGEAGLAIRGGPLHRTHHAWRALGREGARWQPAPPAAASTGESGAREDEADPHRDRGSLVLGGEVAAISLDDDEERSLRILAETVRELSAQARGEQQPAVVRARAEVVCCGNCGAPLAPADREVVRCPRCTGQALMPETVRAEVAAQSRLAPLRAESERLLRRLLRQPGARFTNLLLLLALPPLALGFPVASALFDEYHQARHLFGWREGLVLFAGTLAFVYALSWLVRAQVAGRQALRIIATRFAAHPPESPGLPWMCHRCGGALPESGPEGLVVRCAYCRSDCLVGLSLRPLAHREERQSVELRSELRARLWQRRRLRLVSLASLAVMAACAWALLPVIARARG